MADRRRRPSDEELERALRDLGSRLDYPTPDLRGPVRRRLQGSPSRSPLSRRAPSFPWRRAAAGALALILTTGVVLGLSPATRSAVAEWLGLGGITIVREPSGTGTRSETDEGGLRLGERVTLAQARALAPYQVLVPTLPELGDPDAIFFGEPPPGGQITLVYEARPGIPRADETGVGVLLTEFRGDTEQVYFKKVAETGTRVEPVSVNGGRGFWLAGRPHFFMYRDARGDIREEDMRLAGNTLIWEQEDLTLRLESDLSRDGALRIAESVR